MRKIGSLRLPRPLLTFGLLALLGALVSPLPALAEEEEPNPDPWEGLNRPLFKFNDGLDYILLKPLAKGYKYITPAPVERGISNVFANLREPRNIVNNLLQGKLKQAGNDTGRFLVNSSVGLLGIFEAAEPLGLSKSEGEDFGQTLATWGAGPGPYIVIPFLGSSSLRDSPALVVDSFLNLTNYIDHVPTRNTTIGTGLISTRAELLRAEQLISGDKYSFIRDAYLQRRQYLINDGEVDDDFDDFGDDFDDFEEGFDEEPAAE